MIELNDSNFKEEIANRKIVLVDFYATWCGPCQMQAEVLDRLSTSRSLGCDIAKVNVDNAIEIASEYKIDSIPTLMIFVDNKLVKKIVGLTGAEEIINIIEEVKG